MLHRLVELLNKISSFFSVDMKELEYRYLCEAVDLIDLERRMKEIDMRKAPFQN